MFTVLFTTIGRRVELIRAFKNSYRTNGIEARIIGVDAAPQLAPAGFVVDACHRVPLVSETDYVAKLLEICTTEKVDLLIPLFEPEFSLLDENRSKFEAQGTLLLLSEKSVLARCQDKYATYQLFLSQGLKTPKTWIGPDHPQDLQFPLIIKPRSGMGSMGVQKIVGQKQWDGLRGNNTGMVLQDYIQGTEYTLDILADFQGRVLAVVPRQRLEVRGGEVSKSRTVKRHDLMKEGIQIVESLGAIGPLTVQCIDDGEHIYWLEINPRFGGGVPLAIRAGVDYPYILYQLAQKRRLEPMIGKFQSDLTMLRYDEAFYF